MTLLISLALLGPNTALGFEPIPKVHLELHEDGEVDVVVGLEMDAKADVVVESTLHAHVGVGPSELAFPVVHDTIEVANWQSHVNSAGDIRIPVGDVELLAACQGQSPCYVVEEVEVTAVYDGGRHGATHHSLRRLWDASASPAVLLDRVSWDAIVDPVVESVQSDGSVIRTFIGHTELDPEAWAGPRTDAARVIDDEDLLYREMPSPSEDESNEP